MTVAIGIASHDGVLGRCDDVEFGFGLDLILEGLERRRDGLLRLESRAT